MHMIKFKFVLVVHRVEKVEQKIAKTIKIAVLQIITLCGSSKT